MMATGCDATSTGMVIRRQKDGTRKEVPCPIACVEYNKYMGGVDCGDQLRGYHQCRFKSRNFYKYIANFLFGVAVTNSYILFSFASIVQVKKTEFKFREKLALGLIGDYCTRQKVGRCGGQYLPQLAIQHSSHEN